MAFQRVIINNLLMTNSSDIYSALGDRETIMKEKETDARREGSSPWCVLMKLQRVRPDKVSGKTLMEGETTFSGIVHLLQTEPE